MIIENEDNWYTDAFTLVELARGFYRWTTFQTPNTIATLEGLMNVVILPTEPDGEPDDNWRDDSKETYWTIERMFEDL